MIGVGIAEGNTMAVNLKKVSVNPGSAYREFRLMADSREIRRHVGESPEPLMGFVGKSVHIEFRASHGWVKIS